MAQLAISTFNPDAAAELSKQRSEPDWLQSYRQQCANLFNEIPPERSPLFTKYVDITAIDLTSVRPLFPSTDGISVPETLKPFVEQGPEAPFLLQLDSNIVKIHLPSELQKQGIIFTDIATALRDYPDLIKPAFDRRSNALPQDKYEAFTSAFFNTGVFIHVPAGIEVGLPLRTLLLNDEPGGGVIALNLMIAQANSKVTFIEEGYSTDKEAEGQTAMLGTVTELYAGEGAEMNYSSIQSFAENVAILANRRSIGQKDSHVTWTLGHFGGSVTRSRLESVLEGPGSTSEDVEVLFGSGKQRFDAVSDLTHLGQSTTGTILVRGVLRDKSRSIFKGIIRIGKGAKNSNAYLSQHAMLMSRESRSDAIPGLEIETNEVKATHSASVSQIDEEQIFYLESRGIPEDETKKMITLGFFEPAVQRIPVEEVGERIKYLFESKWHGARSAFSVWQETKPEVGVEAKQQRRTGIRELFEQHYKYR